MIAKAASKQVAELTKAPKIKPNLRPILPIIFAAKIVKIAVPTTAKAVGNVDKDFIEVIWDPTIPLKKTVIILAVNPKLDSKPIVINFYSFIESFTFISINS